MEGAWGSVWGWKTLTWYPWAHLNTQFTVTTKRSHSTHFYFYADFTQLYLSMKLDDIHHLVLLQGCLKDIGCVQIQGLHPSEATFVGQLGHSKAAKAAKIRKLLQMWPRIASSFSPELGKGFGCILHGPPYPRIHWKSKVKEILWEKWWLMVEPKQSKSKLLKVRTEFLFH